MPYFENAIDTHIQDAHFTDVQNISTTNIYLTEERALAALRPAPREGYDVPRCMDGTRESVFEEIDSWLDDGVLLPISP
jgi:hypothetical protein